MTREVDKALMRLAQEWQISPRSPEQQEAWFRHGRDVLTRALAEQGYVVVDRNALVRLRSSIHACNRNPIPRAKACDWREALDSMLAAAGGGK